MQQTTLSRWSFGYINSGSVNSNTRPAATQGSSSTRSTGSRPALSESRDPLDSGLPKPCGQPLVWAEVRLSRIAVRTLFFKLIPHRIARPSANRCATIELINKQATHRAVLLMGSCLIKTVAPAPTWTMKL